MKVTIDDVAKKAGVSKTTVSRILNGHYEHATEETRKRVLDAISELNYRPNALAQGLKSMKTNVIGIILSNLQNSFWPNVLQGAEDTCRSLGYNLIICNSNENPAVEEELIRSMQMRQVDGIIINPTLHNVELYNSLVEANFPLVSLKKNLPNVDSVFIDNVLGSQLVIDHFLKMGKRRIAIMVYPLEGVRPRIERMEGYKKTMLEHGIPLDESLIHIVPEGKGYTKEVTQKLLTGSNRPDAIYSTHSVMTLDIIEAVKEMNIKIPDDIALVGYDENVWSKYMDPPLTTVKQPSYEMGVLAAKRMLELIESKNQMKQIEVFALKPELIVRRSCGTAE